VITDPAARSALVSAPQPAAEMVIGLRELTITPEGDAFMVGDLARGEFIEVPPIAVVVINALRDGYSIAEASNLARAESAIEVDVVDFVETLRDMGFVASIGGVPIQAEGPKLTDGGRAGAALARLARPLYSTPAWTLYGVLFVGCLVLLIAVPWFRPRYGQMFFLSNPVLSVVLLTVIATPIVMLHELAHWLGARIEGVPARITISRRYYLVVAQTDLSALWALPRRRRFGPLLAGMALDTVVTSALLCARYAQHMDWWHPQPTIARLLAALVLGQAFSISFQFVVFLRTDLYGVLVTGLGCRNLSSISRLRMARLYRRLTSIEEQELGMANPRDMAVARWYSWIQLGGAAVAIFYFVLFFAPAVVHMMRWVASGLTRSSPGALSFWVVLASGCIECALVLIPSITYLRDRLRRSRRLSPKAHQI
jgi:putative peptide zinc metalloprotease protein